jgi:predicted kinase
MSEFNSQHTQEQAPTENISVDAIKARISEISSKPLSEHSDEFEAIHAQLQKALSGIDGL